MQNPGKVRARTYGTKLPGRSEALRFIDSAKSPSTKIDGSLVNFRRRLSNRHGRPRRMLTMDIRRTPIGLWARLRDSHKSDPQSGWSLAWTLAQRNDWNGKSWPKILFPKNVVTFFFFAQTIIHHMLIKGKKIMWVFGWNIALQLGQKWALKRKTIRKKHPCFSPQ